MIPYDYIRFHMILKDYLKAYASAADPFFSLVTLACVVSVFVGRADYSCVMKLDCGCVALLCVRPGQSA